MILEIPPIPKETFQSVFQKYFQSKLDLQKAEECLKRLKASPKVIDPSTTQVSDTMLDIVKQYNDEVKEQQENLNVLRLNFREYDKKLKSYLSLCPGVDVITRFENSNQVVWLDLETGEVNCHSS